MMSPSLWVTLVVCFAAGWRDGMAADAGSAAHAKKVLFCYCPESNGCEFIKPGTSSKVEVMVMTSGAEDSNMVAWNWDAFHVVIQTSENLQADSHTNKAACLAHSKGKRFGFTMQLPDFSCGNTAAANTTDWIESLMKRQRLWYADYVVVDMIRQLDKACDSRLKQVDNLMTSLSNTHQLQGRILCIMPWNPPCLDNSCNLIISILNKCVSIIMSPDSYTPDDSSCKAQGTVPIGKFLYGMDQYLNLVKDYRKIVAGIPWHGYKYNCSTLDGDTCMLSKTEKKCNFNDRQKVQFVELGPKYGLSVDKGTVDNITQSVFYNSKEGDRKIQLWFENHDTLVLKYRLVKDLNLQGFAIWYAEDLTYGISMKKLNFDKEMWGWLQHQIMLDSTHYTPRSHIYADTVAGVGVGCLLLGTVLGVTFACIALRRCDVRRSRLNRPFKLDDDDDDYRDDNGL